MKAREDVREAENASGQCLGPDDDVYQQVFPVDNSATADMTGELARIGRLRHLSDEYLRLQQEWQTTNNDEVRARCDEIRDELTTLTSDLAFAAPSTTSPV